MFQRFSLRSLALRLTLALWPTVAAAATPEPELTAPVPETVPLPSMLLTPHLLAPGDSAPAAAAPPPETVPAGAATLEIIEPVPAEAPKLWCGRIEAGLNGADGNTELFQLRFGGKLKRETPRDKLIFDLLVARAENFGALTENKAIFEANNDLNLADSRWAWFVNQLTEYDEFRNFDLRLTLHTGLTYHVVKGARGFLDVRSGAGTSRELGSPQTEFVPETKYGFDAEFKITPRQKLTGSSGAFVDVSDPSDLRVNSRAGYAILIDADRNLNFELGILDRYDSTPNGAKPNDIDYNLLFFWEF